MQKNTTRSFFLLTGIIVAVIAAYGTIEIVNNSAYGFIDIQTKKFPFSMPLTDVCGGVSTITKTVTIKADDSCDISDRTLTITEYGHIRNFGTITIDTGGTIVNNSDGDGIINNGGTIQINQGGILNNNGIIYNSIDGLIQYAAIFNNNSNGTINNYGEFFAIVGTLTNDGTLNNYGGTLAFSQQKGSSGSVVNNNGIINNDNDGNVDGAIITIGPYSIFNNNGTLNNTYNTNNCHDTKQIITNYGIFNNLESGIVNNYSYCIFSNNGNGIFNNDGVLTGGTIINNYFATINNINGLIEYNYGEIDNGITNLGTINNTSTITLKKFLILNNTDGGIINNKSMGVIDNYYIIDNYDGIITNYGTINEYDGNNCNPLAKFNGNSPEINPLIPKNCQ